MLFRQVKQLKLSGMDSVTEPEEDREASSNSWGQRTEDLIMVPIHQISEVAFIKSYKVGFRFFRFKADPPLC